MEVRHLYAEREREEKKGGWGVSGGEREKEGEGK